jgi:hypothetical protein
MAYEFQVAVDCAEPHTLADWWAQTLGWQVEPQDEGFIRRMISAGHATPYLGHAHRPRGQRVLRLAVRAPSRLATPPARVRRGPHHGRPPARCRTWRQMSAPPASRP